MKGMCPGGCGETGSVKAITAHMSACSDYAKRFASGDELRSPEEEYRVWSAARAVEQAPKPARRRRAAKVPEVSGVSVTVAAADPEPVVPVWETPVPVEPKATVTRRASPPVRVSGPVFVERWETPENL